jgi:hypothetical protein
MQMGVAPHSGIIMNMEMNEASRKVDEDPKLQGRARCFSFLLTKLEQFRVKIFGLGEVHSLHKAFEGNKHFYYPQRLWIAFALSNVALVFLLVIYYFGLNVLCEALHDFRLQIMDILAQSNSFVVAAPVFLEQMTKFSVPESLRSTCSFV